MNKTKQFVISKDLVLKAYKLVKANKGTYGVDEQSIKDFDVHWQDNLYKLWNRMSSGTYFPPAVKAVSIPKKQGGERILGIPTVGDRIAQLVVKLTFEEFVEPYFLNDSYGYRPNKSALDAVGITRERCWKYDYVLEFDVKGLFDNIDHDLLMKAVLKHTDNKWVILYIKRWLKAPQQMPDGAIIDRTRGTPQGGVISPLLSNLFMHYVFDVWMKKQHPKNPWCRYADDGLVHCRTLENAQNLLTKLTERMNECGLDLHPEKTKIVYCKDGGRKENYPNKQFDFLGFTFRQRTALNRKENKLFLRFLPAVSRTSQKAMRQKLRKTNLRNRTDLSLEEIAKICNPILRGWIQYYGKFHVCEMDCIYRYVNLMLINWAKRKYKKLKGRKTRASIFMQKIYHENKKLFVHWMTDMATSFA